MSKEVILTGLRANNDLHLGNYLGALLPMIDMVNRHAGQYQINLFVPDLHSFTTPIDHTKLYEQTLQNIRMFVAAGLPLDNDDVFIYRQSYIPAHSELTWILDCFTSFHTLRRMQQFEDKAGLQLGTSASVPDPKEVERLINALTDFRKEQQDLSKLPEGWDSAQLEDLLFAIHENWKFTERALERQHLNNRKLTNVTAGLYNYPVLMAADILLYRATYVPVGDDQTQHLEFTRDVAERMNNRFGDLFTVPKPVKAQHEFFGTLRQAQDKKNQGLRVRDLADPTKKMSKSDETGKGVIFLTDSPGAARKKIMSATTDSLGEIQHDYAERPGISNLLDILKLLGGNPDEFIGQNQYGPLKSAVADKVTEFLEGFQTKLGQVDDRTMLAKLEASERAMNEVANQTLLKVQQAVGLRPKS